MDRALTDQFDLAVPRKRRLAHRERNFTPIYFRDRLHAPEPGLGGAILWVTFRGENIGAVRSLWNAAHGVHWLADVRDGRTLAELVDGVKVARVFADSVAATNALLEYIGIEGTYDPTS